MPLTQVLATDLRKSALAAPPNAADHTVEIDTRFGRFAYSRVNVITMPQGVLGFSGFREFVLLTLPDPRFAQFRLLQCVSAPALSFLVVPSQSECCGIDQADLDEATAACGIAGHDVAFLLIVTIRKSEGKVDMTVNMRAPIVLDLRRQLAQQYVLANSRYSIRHRL
jgi:flagellar assembly factor FliW